MHKKVGEAYAIIQCPECKYKNAEANLDVPLKIPLFTTTTNNNNIAELDDFIQHIYRLR